MLNKKQIEALAWFMIAQNRQLDEQVISNRLTQYPPKGVPQMDTDDIQAVIESTLKLQQWHLNKAHLLMLDAFDSILVLSPPAFSSDCPECQGTGFKQVKTGSIILETPCYRCFDLAGQ